MKGKRLLAVILAVVLAFPAAWGSTSMTLETQAEEGYYVNYMDAQGDREMLPNEDKYLSRWIHTSMWNAEYSEGADFEFLITDMEILNQYQWDENGDPYLAEEDLFWLDGNSENGWNLHSDDHGYAELRAYYINEKDQEVIYDFEVYSVGEIYYLELFLENDTNNILKNSEENVGTRLTKKYQDENGNNQYNIEIEDYILEVDNGYNEEIVTAAVKGKEIRIQTGDVETTAGVNINVYTTEGNEKLHRVGTWLELNICEEYYNIQPTSLENPGLGEVLDLSELYVARYNAEHPEGERMSSVEARLGVAYYERSVLEPTEEGTLPNFVRFGQDGANVGIRAEAYLENEWVEVTNRDFWFDWLDYSVWLEDMQYGDHGYVYVDDEVIFQLNTDNLNDKKDYEVTFDLGIHQEETQEFIPFKNQKGLFETVTKNGEVTGIKIKGADIKEIEASLAEGGWFWVRVTVTADGQEMHSEWRGVELREAWVEYHYNEWGFSMLPYWDHGIGKTLYYYVCDAENPEGYDGEIQYTDIQIEIVEGEEDALIVEEWEDGTGWNLHANSYGHAVITLTHEDVFNSKESVEHSFDVWIGQDVWNINFESSTGTSDICPGGSMDLNANIEHYCYNEEEGHFDGFTESLYYEWGYVDGANEHIIDYEAEGNVVHITAREDAPYNERTGLYLRIYPLDEDGNIKKDDQGNQMEVCYADYWFDIREAYFKMQPLELKEELEIGETVEITPTLQWISEAEEVDKTEEVQFEWEWDPNAIEIKDEKGKVLMPNENGRSDFGTGTYTLKRLAAWDTNLSLRAYMEEDGECYEIAYRGYYFRGMNYDVWFEKDRGDEGWCYLFAEEEAYQVTLNLDNLRDENGKLKENISIEWNVGVHDNNGNLVDRLLEGEEYTFSEDGFTIYLNGQKLYENGHIDRNVIYVTVRSNGIPVTEEPYRLNFWLQDSYVELETDYEGDTLLAEIGGWYHGPEGIGGYVRNVTFPEGEYLMFEIRNIETSVMDDGEDEVFDIIREEDGSWRIAPLRCGQAQIIYTLYHEALGEFVLEREKGVGDEIYQLNFFSDTFTLAMLPDSELNLITEVVRLKAYEDGSWEETYLPKKRYEISYDYNPELINIDENGKVTSFGEFGETGLYVEAKIEMDNGADYYYHGVSSQVWVTDYYMTTTANTCRIEDDGTIAVKDLGIKFLEVTMEYPDGKTIEPEEIQIRENVWYELSEDGQSIHVLSEEFEDILPAARRIYYAAFCDGWEISSWADVTVIDELVEKCFSDVKSTDWFTEFVQYVYDHGVMTGKGNTGRFDPTGNLTRAQFVELLWKLEGKPIVKESEVFDKLEDAEEGAWYEASLRWAFNNGIMTGVERNGKKYFDANQPLKRQQMAKMLYEYAAKKGYDVDVTADYSHLENADQVADYAKVYMGWAFGTGMITGKNGTDLAPMGTTTRGAAAKIMQVFCEGYDIFAE